MNWYITESWYIGILVYTHRWAGMSESWYIGILQKPRGQSWHIGILANIPTFDIYQAQLVYIYRINIPERERAKGPPLAPNWSRVIAWQALRGDSAPELDAECPIPRNPEGLCEESEAQSCPKFIGRQKIPLCSD